MLIQNIENSLILEQYATMNMVHGFWGTLSPALEDSEDILQKLISPP